MSLALDSAEWVVAADPNNIGKDDSWWKEQRPDARPVRVPGILQEALPGYHGVAWYWCTFTPPPAPYSEGRCLIRFDTVDYLADVWLNEEQVGSHEAGNSIHDRRYGRSCTR